MQRLCNLPEVSQEEHKELMQLFGEIHRKQIQEIAKWRRRKEPPASRLLLELLLDKIKPPGMQ
jgi:hypothetical protein